MSQKAREYAAARKQHAGKLVFQVGYELSDMDYQSLTRRNGSVTLAGLWRDNTGTRLCLENRWILGELSKAVPCELFTELCAGERNA
jgi:hypothetical protein